MVGAVSYLTRDGESVCLVCAFDDASDALDGTHELCKLVCVQVCDARNGTRRTHEHVWKEELDGTGWRGDGAAHVRPGTIGLRLTIA